MALTKSVLVFFVALFSFSLSFASTQVVKNGGKIAVKIDEDVIYMWTVGRGQYSRTGITDVKVSGSYQQDGGLLYIVSPGPFEKNVATSARWLLLKRPGLCAQGERQKVCVGDNAVVFVAREPKIFPVTAIQAAPSGVFTDSTHVLIKTVNGSWEFLEIDDVQLLSAQPGQ